ncbi:DPP IV N-terminal domain-containing protein [Pelomonas sp. SE-A7]|uniref:DPP IV N-terminal domain-containing protein n=1 Tax=Pelomonas sp. SE-A7 TaxID=3054953 RepID=UPI00259CD73B|nr:DPP IV N-terminal domain-containing protein [Pelomonas sp. SE-A7]MDM4768409.1 DPP IV N-terminal domain-containing protein [Pelomonas sp. SE-A7]
MRVVVLAGLFLAGCAGLPLAPPAADLLFSSTRDGPAALYLLKAGQAEPEKLASGPGNWPGWAPDGRRIVFQSRRTGNLDIYTLDLAGGEPRQLTNDVEPDYLPEWSPDGTEIVFTSWRKEAGETERAAHLYLMKPDGSGQRRLPIASLKTSAGASWSPDGKRLVYSRQMDGKGAELFVADRDGGNEKRLTQDSAQDIHNGSPAFSPDGQWIAFYSDAGKGNAQLQVIRPDGSERRTVRAEGKNWYPRWSPDGRWLLVTGPSLDGADANNMDLLAVPLQGEPQPRLVAGGPKREQEGSWRPAPR